MGAWSRQLCIGVHYSNSWVIFTLMLCAFILSQEDILRQDTTVLKSTTPSPVRPEGRVCHLVYSRYSI